MKTLLSFIAATFIGTGCGTTQQSGPQKADANTDGRLRAPSTVTIENRSGKPDSIAAPTKVLAGGNPKGDFVQWKDGTAWKDVSVSTFEMKKQEDRMVPTLNIEDVPPGFKSGVFSDFIAVTLRGESPPPPAAEPISVVDISRMYFAQSLANLPPLKAQYDDMYVCAIPADWKSLTVKPSFSGIIVDKDKNEFLARFFITVTHLLVREDTVLAFARKTKANDSTPERWYSDIHSVIFRREPKQ